ncbi:PadR family transcriptional regulator [Nocardia sp. NEAU-G5]|uniref:PadR family transcriptional regulator n=1 Tax=Nocardia albiluteola TaxID=2842303 RepID=A0ABS6AQP0_9NOCA|nr:PadR family transcriptional regulator [Nocardia albiluteola]MBU3060334.1 PadR family transcriptional regulator [Nocardia albiluteola]
MSLRHAVLGLLVEKGRASGYDLLKTFDMSLAGVWPATQSQLYTELGKLATEGLIEVTAEGARGRKEYEITASGREELRHWLTEVPPKRPLRDEALLRIFFLGQLDPEQARRYLLDGVEYLTRHIEELQTTEETIDWDADNLSRYGRLVLDYGISTLSLRREWLAQTADEVAPESAAT